MARSAKYRRALAAWARIEALGGHGVWEPDMCVVSLARTAVTDSDLSLFRDFPYVHILDLSHTGIGDAGLAHLAGLVALESLGLSHTGIGDAGLAHLASLEALKHLSVEDTKISGTALDAFRRARPSVHITTEPPPKGAINPFTGKPWREGGAEP
jgi:Leucine Rich repeat